MKEEGMKGNSAFDELNAQFDVLQEHIFTALKGCEQTHKRLLGTLHVEDVIEELQILEKKISGLLDDVRAVDDWFATRPAFLDKK